MSGAEESTRQVDVDREGLRLLAWRETAAESRRGIFAFPAALLVVAGLSGAWRGPDWFVIGCALVILGSAGARAVLVFAFDRLYPPEPARWRCAFAGTVLASGLAWGLFTAWQVSLGAQQVAALVAVLITSMLIGQSIIVYSASRRLVVGYLVLMVLPLLAHWVRQGLVDGGGETALWLAVAATLYCSYCLRSSRAFSTSQWQRLEKTRQLAVARDQLEKEVARRAEIEQRITGELRGRELEYRKIFQQAHDAIMVIDPENEVVLEANDRATEVYGFSREELVGMSLLALTLHPELGRQKIEQTLAEGHFLSFETRQRRKDGSILDLEINASAIEFRGALAILSINRDVTDRKRADELRLAKEAAERMTRAKGQFLANMSHEIRTPLAGMIGLTNQLRSVGMADREREWVNMLHASAESLLRILDDILDLSKIEDGKLDLVHEPFDFRAEIQRVVELMRVPAEIQGLSVEVKLPADLPPTVMGDAGRLRQVLLNLFSNAIKFTHEGNVSVRVECSEAGIAVAVCDTGIGIEHVHQQRIFEPFAQSDATTSRRFGGTGLGLTICRRLVVLMGGEISVDSEPGRGSEFRFTLPLILPDTASPKVASTSTALPPQVPGRRVLLVEDNPVVRMVAQLELEQLGFEVETANDGSEALEAVEARPFDLLLMDVQMPELDGYETTRRIRARERKGEHIPIIALTALALQGDREKCLAAGMDDYLTKPLRSSELGSILARWLP